MDNKDGFDDCGKFCQTVVDKKAERLTFKLSFRCVEKLECNTVFQYIQFYIFFYYFFKPDQVLELCWIRKIGNSVASREVKVLSERANRMSDTFD